MGSRSRTKKTRIFGEKKFFGVCFRYLKIGNYDNIFDRIKCWCTLMSSIDSFDHYLSVGTLLGLNLIHTHPELGQYNYDSESKD